MWWCIGEKQYLFEFFNTYSTIPASYIKNQNEVMEGEKL
jgi:hypothetical protein